MAAAAGELRVPTSLQKARLKVEEKTLDFEFEVLNAQFNSRGRYALRLTVENPLLEGAGAGVRLRVNDGEAVRSDAGTTDVVEQSEPDEICSFRRRKFIFTLPRGFCKNDRNHDARLRIEALRVRGPAAESGRRVGEAFFAIYPRPNQPRMNLFAGTDEDLYRYGGVTPLLRAGGDRLARHCGRLAFAAAFHEHRPPSAAERARRAAAGAPPPPPAEGRARSPEARQRQGRLGLQPSETRALCKRRDLALGHLDHLEKLPAGIKAVPEGSSFHLLQPPADPDLSSSPELPGDSADEHLSSSSSSSSSSVLAPRQLLSCSSFHLSSPGYSPDLTSSAVQVAESPAGEEEEEEVARAPEAGRRHVARAGKEVIAVTLHGASNLPAPRAGTAPRPYVLVKTIRDEEQQRKGQVTHASSEPTYSPTWEEEVTVEIDAEDASWEALALTVADGGTKEALATYRLPVRHLRPFHRYHCRLALPRKRDPAGTSLYVTLVRKGSAIPRCAGVGYAGLEVFLEGMTAPLATPPGALVAAARVVAEGRACRGGMAKRPAVGLTAVAFPAPSAADFSPGRGCAQMTSPAGPPEKPTWNTTFLFQGRDGATIFSEDAALVIEYYPFKAMSDAESALGPLGYSVLPLLPGLYRRLAAEGSRSGVRVDGLAVQGTDLKTVAGAAPTVRLCLRLIGSERPDTFLSPSGSAALPSLDPASLGKLPLGPPGPPAQDEPLRVPVGLRPGDASLPPADAVAALLPPQQPSAREPAAPAREQRCPDGAGDQQDQEMNDYRLALERMADEILSLRQHVASLEMENSNLRRSLTMHEDLGRTLLSDVDVDVMTKAEIVDRIGTLKHKLASGTVEMRRLKDRVQQLQNELIRKNDQEKDLVMLQRTHQQQQAVLMRYQEKVAKTKGLEETVKQQEKVIEAMERMLQERLSGAVRSTSKPAGEALAGELYGVLLAENRRLREELARPRPPSPPIVPPPQALPDVFGSSEKLSLLAKLEKAQARSRVLESQLEEAARRWGREKQELSTRLLEQDHGFRGSSSSVAHDPAAKMPPDPMAPMRRHQTPDPLP